MPKTSPIENRFWEKVEKTNFCWNWISNKTKNGYGLLHSGSKVNRKSLRAHRYSWELHYGKIPENLWVLHKCDNRKCVNPEHLFLGDRFDNMRDCALKNRICTIGQSRLTHCKKGHEFSEENTLFTKQGWRICKSCRDTNNKKRYDPETLIAKAIRARGQDA